nr:nitroreductase family protein [uncultured Draconibacterium sp.]
MEVMTKYEIHPLLEKRWSPRAFSPEPVSEEEVNEIFTAASWAPSAMNEQPWQYVYAMRGTPGFDAIWDCLAPGNQPWTKQAALLFVAIKIDTFANNGNPNPWAMHDVGMANAQLLLQAASKDIYGHMMAGFDGDKLKEVLQLSDNVTPVCVGALGYLGHADSLDEPYRSREKAPRIRKSLDEFVRRF